MHVFRCVINKINVTDKEEKQMRLNPTFATNFTVIGQIHDLYVNNICKNI